MLAGIDAWHESLDIMANQEITTCEAKELAQTHVAVGDLAEFLWVS